MKITEQKHGEIIICALEGEIDINTSPELRKAFDGFTRRAIKKIVIDFSKVSYIDSSGLATLIELLQRLKKIGGHLRLSSLSQKVRNVFEVTKLDKLFEIFDTHEDAIKDF
ncbi:MAG: STAS domain-containing protein [Candidatus Omnitrophota bacterium]|nr:MAG: STAS domain-containing protein [Candidatus Omnitrophota bacterium]